jgi:hypothetical protein
MLHNFVISTEAQRSGETSVLCRYQRNTQVSPLRLRKVREGFGRDDKVVGFR